MSIWTDMQERGTGTAIKKEDLASEIKSISKKILYLVTEYNSIVSNIVELENRICYYHGLNLGEIDRNDFPFLKDTEVNSVLKSNDYTKIKKYYGDLKYHITKLLYDKENLEKEVQKQEKIRETELKEIAEKISEENRKEKERMERRKEKRIETLYDLMIIPVLLSAAAAAAIIKGVQLGFAGVTATGIGLGLLGIATVIMICKKVRKI